MPLTKQGFHLGRRVGHDLIRNCLDQDVVHSLSIDLTGASKKTQPRRRDGHKNEVILVLPEPGRPFFRKDPDYLEGHVRNADLVPHRIFITEQLLRNSRADYGALPRARFLRLGEETTGGNAPIADREVIGGRAVYNRVPIFRFMHYLIGCADRWRRYLYLPDLSADRARVAFGPRANGTCFLAQAAVMRSSWFD